MTGAITQIDITAKDSTAAAFASVNKNLDGLSSSTSRTVAALAGLGISVTGIAAGIKHAIDAADEANKLSQKIGVAVADLAGLELAYRQAGLGADALQTSISKLSKNVASGNEAFAAMGISLRGADGVLKGTRQILGEVSDKFAGYQDGIAKTALAIELFGKSGADLIPFLNAGSESLKEFDETAKNLGLTLSQETAKKAEEFNDTLDLIGQGASGVTRSVAAELLPTLVGLSEQFFKTATDGDKIKTTADIISASFRGLASAGVAVVGTFQTVGTALGGIAAMWGAIANGEFSQAREIVKQVKKDLADNFKSTIDGVTAAWSANNTAVQESTKSTQERIKQQAPLVKSLSDEKAAIDGRNKAQAFALDREHEYIKLLEIERKQRADLIKPYSESANKAEEQLDALKNEISALKFAKENQIDLKLAVEKTTIARLEEKRAAQQDPEIINQINAEIEARQKIVGLIPLQKELQEQTQSTTDQVTELWQQAGRNIQTTLSSSVFDFFTGGLSNMVQNVKNTVLRIVSEFAALKISQAIGLDKIFSVGAAGATTAGISSGGSLLNAASLGSSALSLVRGGFGANSLIGGALSMLPGDIGAFGSGMAGGAIAGVSSPAVMSGASFAAAAGPWAAAAMAGMAVDAFGKAIAGDKTLGNGFTDFMQKIPILGAGWNIVAGLFGRGPLKQKETQLTGDVGLDGLLSAYLTTNFKAKGGLLVGSKHDFAGVNLLTGTAETDNKKLQSVADGMLPYAANLAGTLKSSVLDITTQVKSVSSALNISLDPLKDFHHQINLISESGKALTDEQISGEIASIGDDIVTKLMPSIRDLSKNGETALQTFSRLGAEFQTLTNAATILGKSVSEAQKFISSTTYEGRSAFIDAAGGIDALNQKVSFFAQNFLTSAEQLAPVTEQVNTQLTSLGISTSITKDQFRDLVQSYGKVNGITESTLQSLLSLAPAFIQVRSASDQLRTSSEQLAKDQLGIAFSALQKSVNTEKEKIAKDYNEALKKVNDRITDVTSSIDKLRNLSDSLKATISDIFPLSRDAARKQVQGAISTAKSGGILPDADSLRGALGVLGKIDPGSYRSALDYAREKGSTANMLSDLGKLTDNQITIEERSLTALRNQSSALTLGFESQTSRLDGLLTQGQSQIDALNGINTSVLSVADALSKFNSASAAAGGGSIGGSSTGGGGGGGLTSGNPAISAQQIRDIAATPGITDMQLYQTGVSLGVSFDQYAAATGANVTDLNKWADEHGVPRFAKGGIHRGGLRIVGENGPELEYTSPSRIFSNSESLRIFDKNQNNDLIEAINELKAQLVEVAANTRAGALHGLTTAGILRRVTPDGDRIATGTA